MGLFFVGITYCKGQLDVTEVKGHISILQKYLLGTVQIFIFTQKIKLTIILKFGINCIY